MTNISQAQHLAVAAAAAAANDGDYWSAAGVAQCLSHSF